MLRPAGSSTTTKALIIRLSDIDFGNVFHAGDVLEICPKSLFNSDLQNRSTSNSTANIRFADANFVGNVTASDLAFDEKATCIDGSRR